MVSSKAGSAGKEQRRCSRCSKIVIYVSIVEALLFVVLKVTIGIASGSRALLAASLYSMQDLISSLVAAIGMKISGKPPDHNHPYGHGKIEYIVVVLISVMILLGVSALAVTSFAGLFGGVATAEAPSMMALWLALVCGMACWLLAHFQSCAGKQLNSPALKSCAAHIHSDYISSIAVVISVIGAKLGYPALDHIVAIIEAVHVIFVSGRMLGTAINGLMDTVAEPHLIEKLKRIVSEIEPVRVRKSMAGWAGQTLMARLEVEVPGNMGVQDADELRARIQQAVKTRLCEHSETLVRILPAQ
ncbi:MAG: cation diffusion facilitator family transporter [Planctomycetota bacterium]